jgi:hypothetical protein
VLFIKFIYSQFLYYFKGPEALLSFLQIYTFGTNPTPDETSLNSSQSKPLLPFTVTNKGGLNVDTNNNKLNQIKEKPLDKGREAEDSSSNTSGSTSPTNRDTIVGFLVCFGGLQLSFLLWGEFKISLKSKQSQVIVFIGVLVLF